MCATTVYSYGLAVTAPNGKGMITSLTNAIFFLENCLKMKLMVSLLEVPAESYWAKEKSKHHRERKQNNFFMACD